MGTPFLRNSTRFISRMIKVETDLGKEFFHNFNEYQSSLIRYNITAPLTDFYEDSSQKPGLLESVYSKGNYWYYSLGKRAPKNIMRIDIFQAVVDRFAYLSKNKENSWFKILIKSIRVSGNYIIFETRFKISNLDYILSWVGFSLEFINDTRVGNYRPLIKEKSFMLESLDIESYQDVNFTYTKNRFEGKKLYDKGEIDLGWGVGVPPEFFMEDDSLFHPSNNIPFWFTFQLQKDFFIEDINFHLEGSVPGVDLSTNRLYKSNKIKSMKHPSIKYSSIKVYCSDFPPNRLVLDEIIKVNPGFSFGGYIDYKDMIKVNNDVSRLSINTRIHAGELGMYPEYISILCKSNNKRLYDDTVELLGSEKIHENWLEEYECNINKHFNKSTIGIMKSRFRTYKILNFNSNLFIDFSGVK